MDLYPELFRIARQLLSTDDEQPATEVLLRRVAEAVHAERGFIVLREGDSYEQKFDVRFEAGGVSTEERNFSRSLVRAAIRARQLIHSARLPADAQVAASLDRLAGRSAIAAPLHDGKEVYGVLYLEEDRRARFTDDTCRFLSEFAEMAGLIIRRTLEREALRERSRTLERDLFAQHDFAGIITRHPKMLALLETVAQVADSDAAVLIRGETGTGKELIARALHVNSARRAKPFVALHCSALPGTLLESELFGHVRGAFTAAVKDRPGRIAAAEGGTLFLDEVAEIAPEAQAKLLRFLQFGEVQRVGSDRTSTVDVRVVAATHQDLAEMIRAGRFRQDLYYRLNVIELSIPPLRERRSDVELLLAHYVARYWRRPGERPRWSPRAERALQAHDFPGNVRELAHLVERACLLARGPELGNEVFPENAQPPPAETARRPVEGPGASFLRYHNDELKSAREEAVDEVERRFLRGLMERHDGNITVAAREAGMQRSFLQKLLARHRSKGD